MFKIIYDPTGHWADRGVQVRHLIERTRIPVMWATNDDWHRTLLERIKNSYQFGWHTMQGFEIDQTDGIMSFPGDPDLIPLLYIQNGPDEDNDHLWFYHHDWISIMDPSTKEYVTARID